MNWYPALRRDRLQQRTQDRVCRVVQERVLRTQPNSARTLRCSLKYDCGSLTLGRLGLRPCSELSVWGGMMRIILNIVAGLVVLAGAVWFLQGINVLPGSFMTGQIRWAVYGGLAIAAGILFFL